MEIANRFVIPVTESSQVGEARRRAARLAESVGFDEVSAGRVSIVTSELATNLLKHTASGGNLIIQFTDDQSLEILAINKSPGMQNADQWLVDGYSTSSTLGTGLGAVRRLSTRFDLYSEQASGTAIAAQFHKSVNAVAPFDVGGVNLPKEDEPVCGDAWFCAQDGLRLSVIVADGLGHGLEAAEASTAAIKTFRQTPFTEPAQMLEKLHKALKGTRGAAVSILQIDQSSDQIVFAGLGNVSAVIDFDEKRRHLVPDNGTVGYEVGTRKFRQTQADWPRGSVVVMHSDGLSSSWNLSSYVALRRHSASVIAAVLYRDYCKAHDDVTVVAIKNQVGS